MHFHVLQHVPFEGLGNIDAWLLSRATEITTSPFYESPNLPDLKAIDAVIALGGPMSVNDEKRLPWLREEKRFIRKTIQSGKPVLGICLGAQLMASSLGARVYKAPHTEIGWFPIQACEHGAGTFRFPAMMEVFHWHGETFDLPAGAVRLAASKGCINQAFQVGDRAIGLQFHLETTAESADAMIVHCRSELLPARYVQSEAELRAAQPQRYAGINALMERILSYITR